MKPLYWIILAVIGLGLGGYVATDFFGGPASADALAARAMSASDREARLQAVAQLCMGRDKAASVSHLQRIVKESTDPDVQAAALHGLRPAMVQDAVREMFFEALNNPAVAVRQAAIDNLEGYYGGELPDDINYEVDDPSEERVEVIKRLRKNDKKGKMMPM